MHTIRLDITINVLERSSKYGYLTKEPYAFAVFEKQDFRRTVD